MFKKLLILLSYIATFWMTAFAESLLLNIFFRGTLPILPKIISWLIILLPFVVASINTSILSNRKLRFMLVAPIFHHLALFLLLTVFYIVASEQILSTSLSNKLQATYTVVSFLLIIILPFVLGISLITHLITGKLRNNKKGREEH